jgi:hypothetical protein
VQIRQRLSREKGAVSESEFSPARAEDQSASGTVPQIRRKSEFRKWKIGIPEIGGEIKFHK